MPKTYPKYKPSGIDWIGEVPEHWEVVKFKHCFSVQKGRMPNDEISIEFDGVPYLTMGFLRGEEEPQLNSSKGMLIANTGDVLLLCDGANAGEVMLNVNFGIVSSTMSKVKFRKTGNALFLYRLLTSLESLIRANTVGMGVPHVNFEHLLNLKVPLPPLPEQQAISAYLDEKCAQIEQFIANREEQIRLLDERRKSLISQAVTKGLNPNAPMKETGIPWLGQVPEHWEVVRLKFLIHKIGSGVTPKGGAEVYQDSGVLFIRSQNVHFDGLVLDEATYISEEINSEMKSSVVNFNDVLLNITGASIGRCTVYKLSDIKANVNQHVCIIRLKSLLTPDFLQVLIASNYGQLLIFRNQDGSSREGLNFEQISEFIIPLPPISNQTAILEFVSGLNEEDEQLKSKLLDTIQELKAYKQSLIYEAVTGKTDVREWEQSVVNL